MDNRIKRVRTQTGERIEFLQEWHTREGVNRAREVTYTERTNNIFASRDLATELLGRGSLLEIGDLPTYTHKVFPKAGAEPKKPKVGK